MPSPGKFPLTEEQRQFIRDNAATMSHADIAKVVGRTPKQVRTWCAKNKVKGRLRGRPSSAPRELALEQSREIAHNSWKPVWADQSQPCNVWSGTKDRDGYGVIRQGPNRDKRAHRVAWEEVFGPIPPGLFVLHHCDNPPCCEPTHLFLGTSRDNHRDKVTKGRDAYSVRERCSEGHLYDGWRKSGASYIRYCKTCHAAKMRAARAAKRAAKADTSSTAETTQE